jgi:hypothetical protein
MCLKPNFKTRGIKLNGIAGIGASSTKFTFTPDDGKPIGISVSESDTRPLLSACLLSVTQGSKTPLVSVPLNTLLPTADRPFFPIELNESGSVSFDLESVHAGVTAANFPTIVVHYEAKPVNCAK